MAAATARRRTLARESGPLLVLLLLLALLVVRVNRIAVQVFHVLKPGEDVYIAVAEIHGNGGLAWLRPAPAAAAPRPTRCGL